MAAPGTPATPADAPTLRDGTKLATPRTVAEYEQQKAVLAVDNERDRRIVKQFGRGLNLFQ